MASKYVEILKSIKILTWIIITIEVWDIIVDLTWILVNYRNVEILKNEGSLKKPEHYSQ